MTDTLTLLAIDDEPNNLHLLKLDLEDAGYDVLTAENGIKGWEVLQKNKEKIKAILLDRMMPHMDGIEFMKQLKANESVCRIPVIMQTAAAEKEQVVEGIEAGVYYYLAKPYDEDVMLSIVRAAVGDYAQYSEMRSEIRQFKSKLHIIKDCNFEIQTIEDGKYLSTFLANFFPDPERVVFGISELLTNAIEHGNLGITYQEKGELNKLGKWEEEINQRLTMPEYRNKKATVNYVKADKEIILRITDEGEGFDWEEYLDISTDRATHNHGRGIAMSKMMSFDELEYLGKGNEVICKVLISKE